MSINIQKTLMAVSVPVLLSMTSVSYAGNCSSPCDVTAIGIGAGGGTGAVLKLNDGVSGVTADAINGQDWELRNIFESISNSRFTIGKVGGTDPFVVEDDAPNNTLVVDDAGRVGIGTSSPAHELQINSFSPLIRLDDISAGQGRVDLSMSNQTFAIQNNTSASVFRMETNGGSFQGNQLYLNSDGNIGFGVANPTEALQFASVTDHIRFGTSGNRWDIRPFPNVFQISSLTASGFAHPFAVETQAPTNSFLIKANGNIGMGVQSPVAALHVKKDNASIFVQDTNGATPSNVLLTLSKNGIPAMRFTNTANNSSWDMSQRPDKAFVLSRAGSGAFEFILDSVGNMVVRGSATATAHLSGSSRTFKKDFKELNYSDVLNKLDGLDITEWRYIDKAVKGRHIGPMAEDFYKLFELGPDNKHIAATDMASVAIIAAKELLKKFDAVNEETMVLKADLATLQANNDKLKKQLDNQTIALKDDNDRLQKRLASLEKLVTNIATASEVLKSKGNMIALK